MSSDQDRRLPPERPGPPGGKRDVNRRRRAEQLQTAALGLFLERGIDPVTIDEIARAAKTAKGNFYRYFDDKSDLVAELMRPMREAVREAFARCESGLEAADDEASLSDAYRALALGLIPVALLMPDVVRLYLMEARAPASGARAPIRELSDEIRARAVALTVFALEHDLLRIPDPRISAFAVVGAVEQLAWSVLGSELDAPADQIADTLISLVLSGIRS